MDYYQILGVQKGASPEEIKKAYRNLSKEFHPDRHKGDKEKEEKYKQINRAYEALSDPKKRQAYDQFGSEDGPQFQGGSGNPFGGQGFGDIGDIFETFFGGRGGGRSSGPRETQGRDAEVGIRITLLEAYTGTTKRIRTKKQISCETCGGTGAKEGTKKISCTECKGTGQVTRTAQSFFGMIQQSVLCDRCKGSGKVPETPCGTCKGEGRVRGDEEVVIDVPRGISDGQTLRVRGKGEVGRQGATAGDLFVHMQVDPDARFLRTSDDLRMEQAIPVTDAVLGVELTVETLGGEVSLKIPAGTQPNQTFRVKGKGMPVLNTSRFGDLYVTVNVEVPAHLSRAERKMWEGLRQGE